MPLHALAQLELPGCFADRLPLGGETGFEFHPVAHVDQVIEDVAIDLDIDDKGLPVGID